MRIAAELETQTENVSEVATVINQYIENLAKEEAQELLELDRINVDRAIGTLEFTGFNMNLTAFNASVETVRASLQSTELADSVKEYAYKLHQSYAACTELSDQCCKLTDLLVKSGVDNPESKPQNFQKVTSDIIFQGGILTMQLGIEAARWNNEIMLRHSKTADEAIALLVKERLYEQKNDMDALIRYTNAASALTKNLHADAEANMPHGLTFSYIANELNAFLHKLNEFLELTKH
jgi:hypothetical protein